MMKYNTEVRVNEKKEKENIGWIPLHIKNNPISLYFPDNLKVSRRVPVLQVSLEASGRSG